MRKGLHGCWRSKQRRARKDAPKTAQAFLSLEEGSREVLTGRNMIRFSWENNYYSMVKSNIREGPFSTRKGQNGGLD